MGIDELVAFLVCRCGLAAVVLVLYVSSRLVVEAIVYLGIGFGLLKPGKRFGGCARQTIRHVGGVVGVVGMVQHLKRCRFACAKPGEGDSRQVPHTTLNEIMQRAGSTGRCGETYTIT
jgi:hypothetical protein